MSKKNIAIIVTLAIVAVFLLSVYIWLSNNTDLVNFNPPADKIEENNASSKVTPASTPSKGKEQEIADLVTLQAKDLKISKNLQDGAWEQSRSLNLLENFQISLYAVGFDAVRSLVFDDKDNLFVTDKGADQVLLVKDTDDDGVAEDKVVIDEGLKTPHGIDWYKGDLYVGEETQIVVYRDIDDQGKYSSKDVVVLDLPGGGFHTTRTVKIGPDDRIYVSIGSSCNVCEESDERRAAIVRYNLDGSLDKIVAKGLRNSVGFTFRGGKDDFVIWAVDNGSDRRGDDVPPEEVNVIDPRVAGTPQYGWPYCYGEGVTDPDYPDRDNFCKNETVFPRYNLQAHSAHLGIEFLPQNTNWPNQLTDNAFIAFHGSWNRSVPTGYKVIRIDTSGEETPINFATGWLQDSGQDWGRPVDLAFDKNGNMYLTDDKAGVIYKIKYIK